jgi:murein L,D-transpeptidase YcbB/YkuD
VIGKNTFAALNVPLSWRYRQIQLNLERYRWIPEFDHRPFIVVNVPAFRLWAFDGPDLGPAITMPVIVGDAVDTQTPIFTADMKYVVFSPYWNIPKKIAAEEILPSWLENPEYLNEEGMELVAGFKDTLALEVTPENMEKLVTGEVKVRQKPGPTNSLGRIKFIFPNDLSVYLHDTPAHYLFAKPRRDFSHGCIRVGNPVGLAQFVLRDPEAWPKERIEEMMNGDATKWIHLPVEIPVLIFYSTAFADGSGRVYFVNDIYEQDPLLDAALKAGYPYPP